MNREQVQDWVQMLGILAVIGSLLFVGVQIQQASETRDYEGAAIAQQSSVGWFVTLAEHGNVWARGCAGETLSPEERFVFRKLAMAWLHREVWKWLRGNSIGEVSSKVDAVNAVALNLHSFRGLREEFAVDDEFRQLLVGVTKFNEQLEERLAYLAMVSPDPQFDPQFCGE